MDGAEKVRFDKPVITWVDNFLGFDVGEAVPVGYYDRHRGVWVPEDNGIVVRLLDTDTDGIVGTGLRDGRACGTFLDMLITYFSIVLICFLLQFFHRGLRIGLL